MKQFVLVVLASWVTILGYSQTIQSNGTGGGDWNSGSTWVGGTVPDATNTTAIIVRSGDVVTIPAAYSVQVDQLTVQANGTLIIAAGGVMDVVNGTNVDLNLSATAVFQIAGTLELSHAATFSNVTSATTTVMNGGVYRHKFTNGGTVIGATWQDGSTLEFTGYVSGYVNPSNISQSFYNVVWNTPSLTGYKTITGLSQVRGDFSILSTGTGQLRIFDASSNLTLSVGGDIVVSNNASVAFSRTGTNNTVNIGGSLLCSSSASSRLTQQGTITFNISGDFINSNPVGSIRLSDYSGALATLNLSGDLLLTGAMVTSLGGVANINFVGGTTHTYSSALNQSGTFNYVVQTGNSLDLGTSYLSGAGSFNLQAGATLLLGAYSGNGTDNNGALQNNTTQGNIRVPVISRTYANNSIIEYNGLGAQHIGGGHPSNSNIQVVINNPVSVSCLKTFLANRITLEQGVLFAGAFNITINQWVVNGGSFNPGTGTVIFTGNPASLTGSGTKNFGNLTIGASALLPLPSDNIAISGNVIVGAGATLTPGASTINFTGGNNQTLNFNGTTFGNTLNVNKTGGTLTLTGALNLTGTFNVLSSTTVASNGNLVLLSLADKPAVDGAIGPMAAGAAITGNVTVQRYFGAQDNVNRYFSSPVANATVAQLQNTFSITGDFTGTSFPCTGCTNNGSSLKYYLESTSGDLQTGYKDYPGFGGANTAALLPGVGYVAYMWNGVAAGTVNFVGTINSGSIVLGNNQLAHTVSTPAANPNADGWNLVGNPYPSAVQWNNGAGWSRTNIDPTVWVWDVVGKIWRSYNANTATGNLANGIISSGQGFWVYAPVAGSASITINESAKSLAGDGSYYRRPSISVATIQLKFQGVSDEAYLIQADQISEDSYDAGIDAYKLQTGDERMSLSVLGSGMNDKFGHLGIPAQLTSDYYLSVSCSQAGYYEIIVEGSQIEQLNSYYLVDKLDQKVVKINGKTTHGFTVTEQLQTDSRFYLTQAPPVQQMYTSESVSILCYPNPVENEMLKMEVKSGAVVRGVRLLDQMGKVVSNISYVSDEGTTFAQIDMSNHSKGLYFVTVMTDKGRFIEKVIKK